MSEWRKATIAEVCATFSGGTPSTSHPEYYGGDIAWIASAELNQGRITHADRSITRLGLERSSAKLVKPGTPLLALYGATAGVAAMTEIAGAINQAVLALIPRVIDAEFLYQWLAANRKAIVGRYTQGGQPNLSGDIVRTIEVPLPDIHEQRLIADVLRDADDLVASLRQLITKKHAIKQGMAQQLLTGRTRLRGCDQKWATTQLGNVLAFEVGFPFRSEFFSESATGIRLVRNRDLKTNDSPIYYTGPYTDTYVVSHGDVLVGMDGDFTPCLWQGGIALLNQRVGRIRAHGCSAIFMRYALTNPLAVLEASTGATTVKHLSHRDLESLALNLPPVDEQRAIAKVLTDADAEIDLLKRGLEKARAIKQGMAQQLLSGKTRLPVLEAVA